MTSDTGVCCGLRSAATTRVADQIGRELFTAYLASLKAGADVKINPSALEKK